MKIICKAAFLFYSTVCWAGISSSPSPSPNSDSPKLPSNPDPKYYSDEAQCKIEAEKRSYSDRESGNLENPCDTTGKLFHSQKVQSELWACALSPSFSTGSFSVQWALYRAKITIKSFSVAKYKAPAGLRYAGACSSALYSTGEISRERATCLADNSSLAFYDSKKIEVTKAPKVRVEGRQFEGGGTDGFPETKVENGELSTTTEQRMPQGNRCVSVQKKNTTKTLFNPIGEPPFQWDTRN